VTIELETFYSRRLGSFCWDHVGERVKGRWGGPGGARVTARGGGGAPSLRT
jgi:hypothetical protein